MTIRKQKVRENIENYLSESDALALNAYIKTKPPAIPLTVARSFYELFLTGSSIEEIQEINPSYPKESINFCRVAYDWDEGYHNTMISIQNRIASKVIKAQVEAAALYADTISVANKQHGLALKKYLQTGDESYLKGSIAIKSVSQLAQAVNGLQSLLKESELQEVPTARRVQAPAEEIEVESVDASLTALERIARQKREADNK